MPTLHDSTVSNDAGATKLPEGVRSVDAITPTQFPGCSIFVHYNGPTDQLRDVSMGMCILEPGARPHDAHQHAEEEFLLVAAGNGEIVCGATTTPAGPGSVMYCAANTPHTVVNTGAEPLTFYWTKWMARSA